AVSNSFVILGFRQYHKIFSVGQHKYRQLNAIKKLFDENLCAGLAELVLLEHFAQRRGCLVDGWAYDHSFAGGKPVCLQHDGGSAREEMREAGGQVLFAESTGLRRGDAVADHKGFREVFASLESRPRSTGSDHEDTPKTGIRLKVITNPVH